MEILYIEAYKGEVDPAPYIYTESTIVKNVAKAFGEGDITEYLGGGYIACYYPEEYKPFLELLDSTGIEYELVHESIDWFVKRMEW